MQNIHTQQKITNDKCTDQKQDWEKLSLTDIFIIQCIRAPFAFVYDSKLVTKEPELGVPYCAQVQWALLGKG